jgi:hypothetical protein
MKPKNIKEFIALVHRYETITLEEIQTVAATKDSFCFEVARECTGFGSIFTCTLCLAIDIGETEVICSTCAFVCGNATRCEDGLNESTYKAISQATTPKELLTAYRERAEHIRITYPQYFTDEQTS